MRSLIWITVTCLAPTVVLAQQKRVYIAPDDHTDYFWSADEDAYRQVFLNTLDYYLNQIDLTAANPPDRQARWNCDGSFWLWTYEKNRTPAQFDRLVGRIADGHIGVPLNPLCVCLGAAPAEAVLRGMYYPGRIERRTGLRFRLAYAMENQTHPLGLTSLWAGSGAEFSWKGICGCDSQVPTAWDREHDIYRAVGPDGAEVLMKWNSMLAGNQGMGGYAEARSPGAVVDFVTVGASFNGFLARYPFNVIGCFGKGWDDVQTLTTEFVTTAMSASNATRRIIVSNETDFFDDFRATYDPSTLPVESCSFGNEWELYLASMAEVSARAKRAVEKLRAAEAMAAIVSLHDRHFMDGRASARDLAWMDLGLFYEHDFGMVGPPTGSVGVNLRIAWQHRIAGEIESYVDTLYNDAAAALAGLVSSDGSHSHFYVFNPLGWARTDFADVAYAGSTPIHVVDVATQAETPSQIVTITGTTYLRILAANIPSMGYRVYEIQSGPGQLYSDAAMLTGLVDRVMDNGRVRVTVAQRGAITSLIDHTRGDREFALSQGGRWLNDLGSSTGTLAVENAGPVSVTLRADAASPVPHTTRVTLYRDSDRIDIRNDITQQFTSTQTYSFGFNLTSPELRHEEVGAILRAKLLAVGGDYSPRNARYDWLTINHFADISGWGHVGLTLSNADAYFMKYGNSTAGLLDTLTPRVSILAGGRVVNGNNGIPNQGGDASFTHRFALQTHDEYDPAVAMKTAMEHQNPFVCRFINGARPRLPADSYSAVLVSNSNVLLWSLKPAEEGIDEGLIVRAWNVADGPQSTSIDCRARRVVAARQTSHIETDGPGLPLAGGTLSADFARQQIRTFRLLPVRCLDLDDDGDTDDADREIFVNVLLGADTDPAHVTACDTNRDERADGRDIALFIECFLAGP